MIEKEFWKIQKWKESEKKKHVKYCCVMYYYCFSKDNFESAYRTYLYELGLIMILSAKLCISEY